MLTGWPTLCIAPIATLPEATLHNADSLQQQQKKLSLCNIELSWGPEIMMMEVEPETLKKNQRQTKLTRRQRGIFFFLRHASV